MAPINDDRSCSGEHYILQKLDRFVCTAALIPLADHKTKRNLAGWQAVCVWLVLGHIWENGSYCLNSVESFSREQITQPVHNL
ncbi:uncharacterized protein LOC112342546 isoform X2 [Selaginella moellendorffii]|uniref:uncharacterized protein LOC112342546 isoform X2 n=1 Tax=Selaginella moellendorffii TaxID=88036 RepID=UPI000D1D0BCF|nr:uncharacterized protein LOC112342546 isoform X2 [Selaginella moellendorffii]|eukprot:XP_024520326.1 uncharacterized protein LOC112342546 isoform X2 [Selaginella moellendorffii]